MALNEERLLSDLANDPEIFGEVYDAFYSKIFGYAYRRTADYDAAKDIAAETFLKAFGGIGRFRWRNISVLHWLYRIATNELNKYYRASSYSPEALVRIREEYGVNLTDYSNAETERVQLEEELEQHTEYMRMHEQMRALDPKYQEVISLRFFEQKSLKEIAAILGKREGTVKSLLSRGLSRLKSQLKGGIDDTHK